MPCVVTHVVLSTTLEDGLFSLDVPLAELGVVGLAGHGKHKLEMLPPV